jgi:hypothetical protein
MSLGAGKQRIGLKEQDALNGGVQLSPPLVSSRRETRMRGGSDDAAAAPNPLGAASPALKAKSYAKDLTYNCNRMAEDGETGHLRRFPNLLSGPAWLRPMPWRR